MAEQELERAYAERARNGGGVLLVSMYDDAIASYGKLTAAINAAYAAKNGMDFMVVRQRLSTRDPQWDKVLAVGFALDKREHEVVMWIDGDACFQKHDVDFRARILDRYMKDGKELLVCDDQPNKIALHRNPRVMMPNTGTFVFKNTEWARQFAKTWWATPMGLERVRYHEQDTLRKHYKDDTQGLRGKLDLLPARELNSVYRELPSTFKSKRGRDTLVMHMMAQSEASRVRVFGEIARSLGILAERSVGEAESGGALLYTLLVLAGLLMVATVAVVWISERRRGGRRVDPNRAQTRNEARRKAQTRNQARRNGPGADARALG